MIEEYKARLEALVATSNLEDASVRSSVFDQIQGLLVAELWSENGEWQQLILDYCSYMPNSQAYGFELLRTLLLRGLACTSAKGFWDFMMTKFPLEPSALTSAVSENTVKMANLTELVKYLDPQHPNYNWYVQVSQFQQLEGEARAAFILKNPSMLDGKGKPYFTHDNFIQSLTSEDQARLVRAYLQDPSLGEHKYFTSTEILSKLDATAFAEYLKAPHTPLPENIIDLCCRKNLRKDAPNLLALVMNRPDFKPFSVNLNDTSHSNTNVLFRSFVYPMFYMTRYPEQAILDTVLAHPKTIEVFKNYHALQMDGNMSTGDQGALLPRALAWYVAQGDKYDEVVADIVKSLPSAVRKAVLSKRLPKEMNPSEPIVREFIIQAGKGHLIGGKNPRLVSAPEAKASTRYTSYNPRLWKNPTVTEGLRTLQKATAREFVKEKSNKGHKKMSTEVSVQQQAEQAVQRTDGSTLTFQHQTLASNAPDIFATGRLRSRLHIEGDTFNSKASGGITPKSFPHDSAKSVVTYFTHACSKSDEIFSPSALANSKVAQAQFKINGERLLAANPHFQFILVGLYSQMAQRIITAPDGTELSTGSIRSGDAEVFEVPLTDKKGIVSSIHKKIIEIAITCCINKLAEPNRSNLIASITNPQTPADHQFVRELLDFVPLEWMIPGDVPLRLDYVDTIKYGDKTYDIASLRQAALEGTSEEVMQAIAAFSDLQTFPFLVTGLMQIALRRKQQDVIKMLYPMDTKLPRATDEVYNPIEIYQIESLAQLVLEDFNNDRVYVRNAGESVVIEALLNTNTNVGGAHHAEMAKLQHALHLGNFTGKNALECTNSPDKLILPLGANAASLQSILDSLLTYELTSLLTSAQNLAYYKAHDGKLHPQTGKGATNGKVALQANRLFIDGKPYAIEVKANNQDNTVTVEVDHHDAVPEVVLALQRSLGLSAEQLHVSPHSNKIKLKLAPSQLIAALRQHATCYEGINVLTEDGKLLLADRQNRGLASAGGHHGDKYSPKSIGHGLRSEFGLEFTNPAAIEEEVTVLANVKTISKTGIFVVHAETLIATESTKAYAKSCNMDVAFRADPEEFTPGSEVALTLADMRGKKFYNVMPLAELCTYQLTLLQAFLVEQYPELQGHITCSIDNQVELNQPNKVPSPTFGRLTIKIDGEIPEHLETVLSTNQLDSTEEYVTDTNPLALILQIKQATPTPGLTV